MSIRTNDAYLIFRLLSPLQPDLCALVDVLDDEIEDAREEFSLSILLFFSVQLPLALPPKEDAGHDDAL